MKKTTIIITTILAAGILLTGCGKHSESADVDTSDSSISVTQNDALGSMQMSEPATYDDGMLKFQYDGNTFLPIGLTQPEDDFYELTLVQTDLEKEDEDFIYAYIYYACGNFGDSLETVLESEEDLIFSEGTPEGLKSTAYGTKSENYVGKTYEYTIDGIKYHAILVVSNQNDGNGCYAAMFKSDMAEAIESAKEAIATITIYGDSEDEDLVAKSFERTDAIYEYLFGNDVESSEEIYEGYSAEDLAEGDGIVSAHAFDEVEYEMTVGEMLQTSLKGISADDKVEYAVGDSDVATISQDGVLHAVGEGYTQITATFEDGKQSVSYVYVLPGEEAD